MNIFKFFINFSDRPSDKHTWKWSHTSATPEYLERRHQYRRSEVRYRSKKAKKIADSKNASLERGRIKERRESFISYSREDLLDKEHLKKCDHQEHCECEKIKKELSDTLKANRSKSETRKVSPEALEIVRRNSEVNDPPPLSPLEIKMYNAKTLPKRIEKIKLKRAKKETARFYTDLGDDIPKPEDMVLKIVEATDDGNEKRDEIDSSAVDVSEDKTMNFSKKKDAEIIRSILEKSEFKKVSKHGALRRKSLEQMDKSPLTNRKLSDALAAIQLESALKESRSGGTPISEPLYEELLRNVHVPYKFAPSIVKRSLSVSSSSSTKETIDLAQIHAASSMTINDDDNDGSECDYVTLTYSNEGLETIDGDYVGKKSIQLNDTISCSDTNISYNKRSSISQLNNSSASSDDMKTEQSINDSTPDLERLDSFSSRSRSFLHKLITMKSHDDDLMSRRSIAASISSQKSVDGLNFNSKNAPLVYRQGSEDLGNRIAHVDYADPRTLFPSAVNIFVNKNSLHQRDSVVSSSSDSVCDPLKLQKQINQEPEPFSDSFYEDTAESLLENDFRDSAIYSDDSNERRMESNAPSDEHIYAMVSKPVVKPTPPQIPKKPSIPVRTIFVNRVASPMSPPPVPFKPSNLKSPEIRNAILNVRKVNQNADRDKSLSSTSSENWISKQVQKFQ